MKNNYILKEKNRNPCGFMSEQLHYLKMLALLILLLGVSQSGYSQNFVSHEILLHTGLTFTPSGAQLPAVGATRTYYVEAVKNCTANLT